MFTVLVTGATGNQGGGVIQALLSARSNSGIAMDIRALTRNTNSTSAVKLENQGVRLVQGDLFNAAALEHALAGCDAAYLVTDFRNPRDLEGEIDQGKNFIAAAEKQGIGHLVFSSVAGCEDPEVSHFHTKYTIEGLLHTSRIPLHTVIRPVGFMDLIPPTQGFARSMFLSAMQAVFGDVEQKWIACEDIGKAVAAALVEPDSFGGKVWTVCGDVKTVDGVRESLAKGEGSSKKDWIVWLPRWLVLWSSPFHYREMFLWLEKGVQPGNVEETRKIVPDVMDVARWAERKDESAKKRK